MRLTASIVSGSDVLDVAVHDPLEAVADAEDLDAFQRARIVAAPMTLLMPGAGPPPTRIARLFSWLMTVPAMMDQLRAHVMRDKDTIN